MIMIYIANPDSYLFSGVEAWRKASGLLALAEDKE